MRLRPASVRQRINAVAMVASTMALLAACGALAVYEYVTFRGALVRDVALLSEVVGYNSVAALFFGDDGAANEILAAVQAEESVVAAVIFDADGKEFATFGDTSSIESGPEVTAPSHVFREDGLHFCRPILLDGNRVGSIAVVSDLSAIQARLGRYATVAGITMLLGVAVAFLLSNRMQRVVSGPILYLAGIAGQVTKEHDYTIRAVDDSDGELGVLVSGFNEMLSQIEIRDRALKDAKDNLERRVADRTSDLLAAKDAAEEAARMKSEFLANISHELRTPMHGILSFATFGRDGSESTPRAKLKRYFDNIHVSGSRLLTLLNSLLDLSKLESGRMTMEFRPCEVRMVVRSVVDEFRSLLSEANLTIQASVGIEDQIVIDPDRMMQVVRNIIGNAVKFSPSGGTIHVRSGYATTGFFIEVEDEGVGIPEEELDLVFDRFAQSNKTKTGAGGTGLGLAISQEIVHAHQGRIWAQSGRDQGALIRIEIPVDLEPTESDDSDSLYSSPSQAA